MELEWRSSREGVEEEDHNQGYFHHRSSQGSKNQEHQQEQGWMEWDHREWELFGVPIRRLLAEAELPQSRWLEGRHITLPVPGDFHSAGGDIPQPHTTSEQTEEELAGDAGSEHHLQPPGAFCSPETPSRSHSPRRRAGLHQPQPLVTPKVSFWETAGLVPGCLT